MNLPHPFPTLPPLPGEATDASVHFILELSQALHGCGISAVELEETLARVAAQLGLPVQVFSLPTGLFIAVGPRDSQSSFLLRVQPGSVDLERLVLLSATADEVSRGNHSPDWGSGRVAEILSRKSRYGSITTTASYAVFSAAAAVIFQGGWRETVVAGLIGLVTGLLALTLNWRPSALLIFELLAATAAPVVAALVCPLVGPTSVYLVIAAGLIVLMPGLTLTTAVHELAQRHLASGTARLAGAGIVFMMLAVGTALGRAIAGLVPGAVDTQSPEPLPGWAFFPAAALTAPCMAILFRARPRDAVWILVAAATAVLGTFLGGLLLGPPLEAFVAALVVGLAGNLFARQWRRPAMVFWLPGILLLVPGAVGYRSLAALQAADVVIGVNTAFRMSIVATSLVAGLLTASVVLPPYRGASQQGG